MSISIGHFSCSVCPRIVQVSTFYINLFTMHFISLLLHSAIVYFLIEIKIIVFFFHCPCFKFVQVQCSSFGKMPSEAIEWVLGK